MTAGQDFQLPPELMPQPVPIGYDVSVAQAPGRPSMVCLVTFHAMGSTVLFFPAEEAEDLARKLAVAAPLARTGLIVAPGSTLRPPNAQGPS